MKIVAANHADSLRPLGELESDKLALVDSVREELRSLYGAADDTLPHTLAVLAHQLDQLASPEGQRLG